MENKKLQYLLDYATSSIDFIYLNYSSNLPEVGIELSLCWEAEYQILTEDEIKEIKEFNYKNYGLKFIDEGRTIQVVKQV